MTEIFVSSVGNDRSNGLQAEYVSKGNGPLATPARALKVARQLLKKKTGQVVICLRSGTYCLDAPLVIDASLSGLVLSAYPGERPVLSGGLRITGWRQSSANGKPCWVTDLPAVRKGWRFTQLWVNGQRRSCSRLPKTGAYSFAAFPEGLQPVEDSFSNIPTAMKFHPGHIQKSWRNPEDIKILALQLWFENHLRIASIDPKTNTVQFKSKPLGGMKDEKGNLTRYWVENVFEAMSEPGEWYLDRAEGRLYYIPLPGEEITNTEIVAPHLSRLLTIKGKPRARAADIHIERISFQHAEWTYPDDTSGSLQAASNVPGAVVFEQADRCVIHGCEVTRIAQYAIQIRGGCHCCVVSDCHLHDLGAGGVKVEHEWLASTKHLSKSNPRQCATVCNCRIHNGSRIYLSAIGIWVGNAGGNRLLNNEIFDFNYTGISCGWTWGYAPTATVDNRIEGNHIHHINWNELLSDNGGIYTLGTHPGGVIANNHIHHISRYDYGGWGIYLDEGSSEFIVFGNTIHHTRGASLFTHYGRDNVLTDNVFAGGGHEQLQHIRIEPHRGWVFTRNVIAWQNGEIKKLSWDPLHVDSSCNLFWGSTNPVLLCGIPMEKYQQNGLFKGCIVADPCFVAPEAGDFRLRADSPAIALGICVADPFKAGPVHGEVVPTRWHGRFPKTGPVVRTAIKLDQEKAIIAFTNVGDTAATGHIQVLGSPGVQLLSCKAIAVRGLKPGATLTYEVRFSLKKGSVPFYIETRPVGIGFVPALQRSELEPLKRFPDVTLDKLADVLSNAGVQEIGLSYAGKPLAKVNIGIVGSDLAVTATVIDDGLSQGKEAWQGSSLEIFASAGDQLPNKAPQAICQVLLVPSVKDRPAYAVQMVHGKESVGPAIRVISQVQECGWNIAARVPLAKIGIPTNLKEFLFELAINTHQEGHLLHLPLAWAWGAYLHNKAYLRVNVAR